MKKLLLSIALILTGTIHLHEMRGLVKKQVAELKEIVEKYAMSCPSEPEINAFLSQYPDGVSFQHVFSNRQWGALCGVYAMQNALWYRYVMGDRNLLVQSNGFFANHLNSITNVRDSILNGIESEIFDTLLAPQFESNFAVIAYQQNRYVPLNASGMENFFGDGVGYVRDLIAHKIPVVSLLINYSSQDTYGMSDYDAAAKTKGIPGHWVSVTMIQNATKRVYLMTDSLPRKGHTEFVLKFLNEVELGRKIEHVADEIAEEDNIPANDKRDERLRKEWLHQLSPDDILVKVKGICADVLKDFNSYDQEFIFDHIINPVLLDLDETATVQIVIDNLGKVLQSDIEKCFVNMQNVRDKFDEIFDRLKKDKQRLERIEFQEKLKIYQQKLQAKLYQEFVNNDDTIVTDEHDGQNREMKQLIITTFVSPIIQEYIEVALEFFDAGTCHSLETCLSIQGLVDSITKNIQDEENFLASLMQENTIGEIAAVIMSIIGAQSISEVVALDGASGAQGQQQDSLRFRSDPFLYMPITKQFGLSRLPSSALSGQPGPGSVEQLDDNKDAAYNMDDVD